MKRASTSLVAMLALAAGVAAHAGDADDFAFTATAADLPDYVPTLLANGYFSMPSAPRGTEGNRSYIVALMDYAKGDMSRPAAIPGWNEIDLSIVPPSIGEFWLNRTDVSALKDYRQRLDMREATLTTHYRYGDHGRSTAVDVVSFLSEASPHLAATQLTLTPDFDGELRLSFALILWAPQQPRLAIGELDGEQLLESLTAHGLKFEAVAPATADRAAAWYPGDTHIGAAAIDADDLTLHVDGRAEQGVAMAEAAAIALPAGVHAQAVAYRSPYRLALNVTVPVKKGVAYAFAKFVAVSREGWGGDGATDLALARSARNAGFDALRAAHRAAWDALWQTDIVIDGDAVAQRAVHADLYYLLASTTTDTAWPIGACSLSPGYAGHAFWDSDSWLFPALLLLHPERAKPLVMFRARTLAPAQERAHARGFAGAMYPWESDPQTGRDETPHSAVILSEREIHVNADVAIAQWQYWLATRDVEWLRRDGWPVIRDTARFWASRAEYVAARRRYEIPHVTSVDEDYNDVPNDTFTNAAAQKALRIAVAAAALVGERPDPRWRDVADRLYLPFSADTRQHFDFDERVPHDKDSWGGSALPMLSLPALDLPMNAEVRRNDYAAALRSIAQSARDPNSMGLAPLSIAAAAFGDVDAASQWLQRNFSGGSIRPPFGVRSETARNNTLYFVTAAGGFVQNLLYGFSGLRIEDEGLVERYAPVLPASWKSLTLQRIAFRGRRRDIVIRRDAGGKVVLERGPASG